MLSLQHPKEQTVTVSVTSVKIAFFNYISLGKASKLAFDSFKFIREFSCESNKCKYFNSRLNKSETPKYAKLETWILSGLEVAVFDDLISWHFFEN